MHFRRRASFQCLALTAVIALSACAVAPQQAQRVAALAQAQRDTRCTCCRAAAETCAVPSPYRALIERTSPGTDETPQHYVNLLDRGEESLTLRVHLIRAARHSVDLQTFIFSPDDAGRLVLDELIAAARRGVRVRVLTDQLFSLTDTELLAQLARAHVNFELKIYNPTFSKAHTPPLEFAAGILCCFFQFNQRMHNKLLLIDGAIGIAGGRNYEDRYFDWDADFDYRDRDVLVAGPAAAAQMRASFEQFWSFRDSLPLSALRDVGKFLADERTAPTAYAQPIFARPERIAALRSRAGDLAYINSHFADQALRVGAVEYFSDPPGERVAGAEATRLSDRIAGLIGGASREIVLETPYLVISRAAQKVFRDLRRRHPQLRVLISTNSLAATDAFYVYALSYKYKKRYIKRLGFEIHEFKPFPADAADLVAGYDRLAEPKMPPQGFGKYARAPLKQAGVRLGLHAKSMVIDERVTLIGSHNFDPRSERYNTESGFIIDDRAFAARVAASIRRNIEPGNAWVIARRLNPRPVRAINNFLSDLSTALPLFDLWPFRYATSYEIKPGCAPLPPDDAHFHQCYEAVGDFPGVDLPLKTIYTRIVTAFGAGLVSIM